MSSGAAMPLFARPSIAAAERADGCVLLRSAEPLQDHPATVVHSLRAWAASGPDHPLVAERDDGGRWRCCSYGAADAAATAIGQALLDRGLGSGLDAGEITDQGYVNQRQVIKNRSALIDLLYTQPPRRGVVVAGSSAPR